MESPVNFGQRYEAALRQLAPETLPKDAVFNEESGLSPLEWGRRFGIPSETETQAAASALGLKYLESLNELQPWPEFVAKTPIAWCRRHGVICLQQPDGTPFVAAATVDAWPYVDTASRWMKTSLGIVYTGPDEVARAIDRSYESRSDQTQSVLASISEDQVGSVAELIRGEDLLDSSDRAPVIQLVNSLLFEAVRLKASDVHIQPRATELLVRFRIDGVLFDVHRLPKQIQEEVVTRTKVLGRMNIAEKRLPQDGRASVQIGQRTVDLRIASMPTSHGERAVIRLLDKSARMYSLEELGMDEQSLQRFRQVIHQEHGLILVTGPTGSGKSTTLYSCLQELNTDERNAVTLEDPIEYELDGISQTQINTRKGMTFASGLRSVLRQDPDVIMLGEIRDHETAVMAIQSSLTGHMVFSTLHTNDAASAVTRLQDLGIEPYLAASSLQAVLAQRLVRKICPDCCQETEVTESRRSELNLPATTNAVYSGTGCESCRGTGYQGRIGIFELLSVTETIQSAIQTRRNAAEIRDIALGERMQPMRLDGIRKVAAGTTTIDEVLRVTASG